MTVKRVILPAKYVNTSAAVVYNKEIPAVIRDTYTQLKGLAMGNLATPPVTMPELVDITGKSQSQLYEHLHVLVRSGALLWRHVQGVGYIFSFCQDGLNPEWAKAALSEKSELLNKTLIKPKSLGVSGISKLKAVSSVSEKSEKAILREWSAHYVSWLGYDPENPTLQDDQALLWLAERYTPEQVAEVYCHMKSEKGKNGVVFWADKQIKPRHLRARVPEYHRAKAAGQVGGQARRERS